VGKKWHQVKVEAEKLLRRMLENSKMQTKVVGGNGNGERQTELGYIS
jgi:hypothetical protein